jgi:hypothetical protein
MMPPAQPPVDPCSNDKDRMSGIYDSMKADIRIVVNRQHDGRVNVIND